MTRTFGTQAAVAAADAVRARTRVTPRVGIILGSGLGGIASAIEGPTRIPYGDVPGFPAATIAGHAGELIAGTLSGTPVVALSGRFHMYEGHDAALAGFPVRVLHALGASTLIVSNAAGSARLVPGTLMLITDHINLMFRSPLIGPVEDGDVRFPDMSQPYDPELRAIALRVAREQGIALAEGVYAGLLGPAYETRAEVRMLQTLGADAMGMSTVPEVVVARARGMRVLGVSCVTNFASGLAAAPITHDDVLETTARVAARLQQLVRGVVAAL
ncbi:MAG: purine-nucleoside phosphorylase [Gemmatimonadaceae bacterium]